MSEISEEDIINSNKAIAGAHFAKQEILTHREVVEIIAQRTGYSPTEVDGVLSYLPFLAEDTQKKIQGFRLKGFGTFRTKLLPSNFLTIKKGGERVERIAELSRFHRVMPHFSLERGLVTAIKANKYILDTEAFYNLSNNKLKRLLDERRLKTPNVETSDFGKAAEEKYQTGVSEDVPRRFLSVPKISRMEKATQPALDESAV